MIAIASGTTDLIFYFGQDVAAAAYASICLITIMVLKANKLLTKGALLAVLIFPIYIYLAPLFIGMLLFMGVIAFGFMVVDKLCDKTEREELHDMNYYSEFKTTVDHGMKEKLRQKRIESKLVKPHNRKMVVY